MTRSAVPLPIHATAATFFGAGLAIGIAIGFGFFFMVRMPIIFCEKYKKPMTIEQIKAAYPASDSAIVRNLLDPTL